MLGLGSDKVSNEQSLENNVCKALVVVALLWLVTTNKYYVKRKR